MRRWLTISALLVAVAVVVGLVLLRSGDSDDADDDQATETTSPEITVGGNLDPGASELGGLLAQGRAGTWHAVYAVTPPEGGGPAVTLEVWRKAGRSRQDSVSTAGEETVHTVGIHDGDRHVACQRSGDAAWVCQPLDADQLDPDEFFTAAVGELTNQTVTPSDATIAGEAARCFGIGTGEEAGEMCVTTDGVPLRITRAGASLEVTDLERTVDDSAFAEPS